MPESNLVESPEALLERLLPVRIKSESLGAVMEAEFGSVRVSYNPYTNDVAQEGLARAGENAWRMTRRSGCAV